MSISDFDFQHCLLCPSLALFGHKSKGRARPSSSRRLKSPPAPREWHASAWNQTLSLVSPLYWYDASSLWKLRSRHELSWIIIACVHECVYTACSTTIFLGLGLRKRLMEKCLPGLGRSGRGSFGFKGFRNTITTAGKENAHEKPENCIWAPSFLACFVMNGISTCSCDGSTELYK